MEAITQYLPQGDGYLPRWLLFVAALAAWNSAQNFVNESLTKRIYTGKPAMINSLQSRTFGTWTFLSSVVRCYCAYYITNKQIYDLTIWTYVIVLANMSMELFVFQTAKPGPGIVSPLIVASVSLVWMLTQYNFYLQ